MRLELHLSNSTPMLVGWYDPSKADYVGLRTTEVKGIWRWWARAFISGVLYDKGYLKGVQGRDVLRRPHPREASLISRLVGVDLGLGIAGDRVSMASKFKIYFEAYGGVSVSDSRKLGPWSGAQRIGLLTIGRRTVEAVDQGHRFTLHVELRSLFEYATTALKILLASLQLTGVGKGSRRGFGTLDITHILGDLELSSKLRKYQKDLGGFRNLIAEIYRECEEIVDSKAKEIERELSGASREESEVEVLPPFPVVSKKRVLGIPVTDLTVYKGVGQNLFIRVHNFFVRSERCRVLYGTPSCNDQLRNKLNAWFLGLPRSQKSPRSQRATGYVIPRDISRRPSPVHLTLHTDGNVLGRGAFVSTLLSGDWPKVITWFEGRSVDIVIDDQRIIDAYKDFKDEFEAYMAKINAGPGVAVWP